MTGNEIHIYDERNNETECNYYVNGCLIGKTTQIYDYKNNLLEYKRTNLDGYYNHYKCIYNENGQLFKKDEMIFDNILDNSILYSYDNNGNLVEEEDYNGQFRLYCKRKYKMIAKKIVETEIIYYKPNDSIDYIIKTDYDDKGYKIEENSFDKEKKLNKKLIKSKYDVNGNIIESFVYFGDSPQKSFLKYDSTGNRIEGIYYNSDGTLLRKDNFKIEYDLKGNWIKKIKIENDIPKTVTERVIKYY